MKDKVKNLFSLNSCKSLRLKRYGSWIAYEDQNGAESANIYWYNHGTGEGQWEVPASVAPMIGKSGSLKTKSSSKQMLVSIAFVEINFLFFVLHGCLIKFFFLS